MALNTMFKNGWYNGKVINVFRKETMRGPRIKFYVLLDGVGAEASCLCHPNLLPGSDLYKWVRICSISLESIDDNIDKHKFIDKDIKVYVVKNGEYLNIVDVKNINGRKT